MTIAKAYYTYVYIVKCLCSLQLYCKPITVEPPLPGPLLSGTSVWTAQISHVALVY